MRILNHLPTFLFTFHMIAGISQTNANLPLKSFSFDYVSVSTKEHEDSLYQETGIFTGIGEVHIHNDSIIIKWSNEWECGTYRLFVDTATYQQYNYDERSEWLSHYVVRSKGYHAVDGMLTLVEGVDIKHGKYTDVVFDTQFTSEGWAMIRRIYLDITEID